MTQTSFRSLNDQSWIYRYDLKTKQQSSLWKHPASSQPKQVWQVKSSVKSMLVCFFDSDSIIHKESVKPSQTVNVKYLL